MAFSIIMPKAGMAMETGTILRWLKKPVDPVTKGEALLEIETDKVSMEVEAEASGFLLAITRQEGEVVPVTETIGYIGRRGEPVPQFEKGAPEDEGAQVDEGAPSDEGAPAGKGASSDEGNPAADEKDISARVGRIPATPLARKLARESRVDLAAVKGTGLYNAVRSRDVAAILQVKATPLAKRLARMHGVSLAGLSGSGGGGRITKEDVLAAVSGGGPGLQENYAAPDRLLERPLSQSRRIIAERMLQSHRDIPPVTLYYEVDVTRLRTTRERLNQGRAVKISINDFILLAAARVLRDHPPFRSSLKGSAVIEHPDVHLGMAVALEGGLVVPVIKHADSLSLEQLSVSARKLAVRAREGQLTLEDLEGGVFTVTNLGMYGITAFNPIINPPQSAILGVCAMRDDLVLEDKRVAARKKMNLALTIDHRILDGAQGAIFLRRIGELLENPSQLVG